MSHIVDHIGQKFGRLLVIARGQPVGSAAVIVGQK